MTMEMEMAMVECLKRGLMTRKYSPCWIKSNSDKRLLFAVENKKKHNFHFRKWRYWSCLLNALINALQFHFIFAPFLKIKASQNNTCWNLTLFFCVSCSENPEEKWLTVSVNATYLLVVNGTHQITGLSVISTQRKSKRWLWQNQGARSWNTDTATSLHVSKLSKIWINKKCVNVTQKYL